MLSPMPTPRRKSVHPTHPSQKPPREVVNLEMEGDRLKVFTLQTLLTNKKNPETRDTARLGDVLLPWFEKVVHKPAEKLDGIAELWQTHVPANLKSRSQLVGFAKGVLTVALDSATIRAELDARLRAGLLRQLQTDSKGLIFKVKTCVRGSSQSPRS
jgi:hypothetical protein